ncbi:MAG: S9 family peptidase [Gammaproteobacteria bacterium]|nr:S9 family peptidase [Gammaproteobacteria bacterium]
MNRSISGFIAAILLTIQLPPVPDAALAQEDGSPARRADELQTFINPDAKDTQTKLDLLVHHLYEVNQKLVAVTFHQRYGERIRMERVLVPNVNHDLIPCWLFTPTDMAAGRKYPGIVAVHGGFHYSLDEEYFGYIERFVREGYVVMFPEYRGSRGYGKEWYDAQEYGAGDVDDVLSAAEHLAAKPFINANRLGIVGRSRGGMVTLLAIEKKPKLFAAAVDVVGLADFLMYMAYKPEYRRQEVASEPHFKGLPFDNLQAYIDSSPIMHVKKIEAPLLIHATTFDRTVPHTVHSERLVEALKAHGKKYEYKLYERAPGGHGFSEGDSPQAIDSLNRIVDFLGRHLK